MMKNGLSYKYETTIIKKESNKKRKDKKNEGFVVNENPLQSPPQALYYPSWLASFSLLALALERPHNNHSFWVVECALDFAQWCHGCLARHLASV